MEAHFGADGSYLSKGGSQIPLVRRGNVFVLETSPDEGKQVEMICPAEGVYVPSDPWPGRGGAPPGLDYMVVRTPPVPELPSQERQRLHKLTHLPYAA